MTQLTIIAEAPGEDLALGGDRTDVVVPAGEVRDTRRQWHLLGD